MSDSETMALQEYIKVMAGAPPMPSWFINELPGAPEQPDLPDVTIEDRKALIMFIDRKLSFADIKRVGDSLSEGARQWLKEEYFPYLEKINRFAMMRQKEALYEWPLHYAAQTLKRVAGFMDSNRLRSTGSQETTTSGPGSNAPTQ